MLFEISTFKLAKISSKILDTKKNFFFCRAVLLMVLWLFFPGIFRAFGIWPRS